MTRTQAAAVLALALLVTPLHAKDKQPASNPVDEVKAVEMARGDALIKADAAAIANRTADEFVEINRFGQLRTQAAGKIRHTRIFVRRDPRWQAVAMQHTPMP